MLGRELSDFMDHEWLQTAEQTIARDRSHAAGTMLEVLLSAQGRRSMLGARLDNGAV